MTTSVTPGDAWGVDAGVAWPNAVIDPATRARTRANMAPSVTNGDDRDFLMVNLLKQITRHRNRWLGENLKSK
jgi:hypothetical protein